MPSREVASAATSSVENGTALGERLAQLARQVRHLAVAMRAAGGPLTDLADAIGRLAALGEEALEQSEVHAFRLGQNLKGSGTFP